jgi:hypothetical protein
MRPNEQQKGLIRVVGITIVAIIVVLVIIYIVSIRGSGGVSDHFIEARKNAALVSEDIVRLASETNNKITQVNVLEIKGKTDEALALVQDARDSNKAAYGKAFELSQNLKTLAESLSEINSLREQQAAYEAIAIELSLVSEFISYTQVLNSFLDSVSLLISQDTTQNQNLVRSNMSIVNEKASIINTLNKQFLEKMKIFDGLL